MSPILRLAAYLWAAPNTTIGLALGLLSFRRPRVDDGVLVFDREPRGFLRAFGLTGYRAITFGHVVLSRIPLAGAHREHERAHVRQYERLGPLFLPVYVGLWLVRGYRRHPFERAAARAAARLSSAARPGGPATDRAGSSRRPSPPRS